MTLILLAVLLGAAAAAHLNIDEKIIRGSECPPHSQPWQVYFTHGNNDRWCGGSLIDKRWIISAAHCYNINITRTLIAHLGEHDIAQEEGTEQHIWVEKSILHPGYNNFTSDHDIMLLKLAEPAQFDNFVQPIEVSRSCPVAGTSCLVSGWGKLLSTGEEFPNKLQCLEVPVLSASTCEKSYPDEITSNMFCAGYPEGGKDACEGDSGGPLVCNGELTGIVSWGNKCAQKNQPGVYTTVCNYNAWIDEVIGNN